jgi:hypothetical protein
MNDPVEQSRNILVDDLKTIQGRPNNMQAVIEKLPKNGPKRKELEVCLSNAVQRSGLRRDPLSGLFQLAQTCTAFIRHASIKWVKTSCYHRIRC